MEKTLGKGKVLFAALPLELNDNLQAVADVYSNALKAANIDPVYSTTLKDHGILICPTLYPRATLYVLTSESNRKDISFEDLRSHRKFSGTLPNGRAALSPVPNLHVAGGADWRNGLERLEADKVSGLQAPPHRAQGNQGPLAKL